MKIKTLLAKTSRLEDADHVLQMLQKQFCGTKALAHLPTANEEAYMEDAGPFVRFEMNREISYDYITMIRPEIRDGTVAVYIETNHMKDGLGMMSQCWEAVDYLEDLIECEPEQTIAGVASEAKKVAIDQHTKLIERVGVGVPMKVARMAAQRSW